MCWIKTKCMKLWKENPIRIAQTHIGWSQLSKLKRLFDSLLGRSNHQGYGSSKCALGPRWFSDRRGCQSEWCWCSSSCSSSIAACHQQPPDKRSLHGEDIEKERGMQTEARHEFNRLTLLLFHIICVVCVLKPPLSSWQRKSTHPEVRQCTELSGWRRQWWGWLRMHVGNLKER